MFKYYFSVFYYFGKITLCNYLDLCVNYFFEKCRPWAQKAVYAIILLLGSREYYVSSSD